MLTLDLIENIFLFLNDEDKVSNSMVNKNFLYISIKVSNNRTYSMILVELCKRNLFEELLFSTNLREECELHFLLINCAKLNNEKFFDYLIRRNIRILKNKRFFLKLCKENIQFVVKLIKESLIDGNHCKNHLLKISNVLSFEDFSFVLSKSKLDHNLIHLFYSEIPEKFEIVLNHDDFPEFIFYEWINRIVYPYYYGRINDNLIRKEIIKLWISKVKLENLWYTKKQILESILIKENKVVREAFEEREFI